MYMYTIIFGAGLKRNVLVLKLKIIQIALSTLQKVCFQISIPIKP